ncbi:GNAT family N-acetyltransferase [Thalassobacillus devorans]|uniref:GNAT family N-acetyltransferase n=1 Tax=Thalassobacillus devorans TaxID=279813 RepID=UPI000A1CBCA9|nr:GNAT family N-acetyltransferase [Thalassobacillus devorans]
MEMIYRASMEDLEGVARLFQAYREFYQQESDLEVAKRYIKERLQNNDSVIFVAKSEDMLIGFVQLYPTFSSVSVSKAWILNDLYVDRAARNRGIGAVLLDKAKGYAMDTGANSISLSTAPDNFNAQRLYEKHGYQLDTQFLHYELNLDKI